MRRFAAAAVVAWLLALSGCATSGADRASGPIAVKLIAFNDFHGNLESPHASIRAPDANDSSRDVAVPAGGVAEFATLIERLRAANPNHAVVSAGDMVGASPLASALFLDEPTIAAMNDIGVDFHGVGNHEFDRGTAELLRKQNGGCTRYTALEPCRAEPFGGARFPFLAANVIVRATGKPLFPAYGIKTFEGVKVGFIGLTLKGTQTLVPPDGIADVEFRDEASTINALVPELRAQGVSAIVVLIHEGGATVGRFNDPRCLGLSGDILPILDSLDPAIDVVVSAHTHQPYVCDYQGFLLTSAASYGRLVTDIDLVIDRASGRVTRKSASNRIVASAAYDNVPVAAGYAPLAGDDQLDRLVQRHVALAAPLAERPVGRITATLANVNNDAGERPVGGVVADAELAATLAAGAQMVFLNPGSLRAPIAFVGDGTVTYGALFRTQPFGNVLVTMTLTGAQIKAALEQQWAMNRAEVRIMQTSHGFTYAYDPRRAIGDRVLAETMKLDGKAIAPDMRYRVTVNSFMASGGDDFSIFVAGTERINGPLDIDALESYFKAASSISPAEPGRVQRRVN